MWQTNLISLTALKGFNTI